MTSLTDRYVHAVTAQLPAAQREEISRELRATIEDTVAARSTAEPSLTELEVERRTLLELGHPDRLAESYRGEGRTLIGPRYYAAWQRTLVVLLSIVPPLVAVVMLVVGIVGQEPLSGILGGVASGALGSALQVAFWVTLGFAVAERTHSGREALDALDAGRSAWDPADLPALSRRQVTWGDAIFTLLVNAFLLALLLVPWRIGGTVGEYDVGQVFTDTAYSLRWVLVTSVAISLLTSILVLARGHWTWPTAITNAVANLLFVAPVLWLAGRDDLVAWETFPTSLATDTGMLEINRPATLWGVVAVVVVICLWDGVDGLWKAARRSYASGSAR